MGLLAPLYALAALAVAGPIIFHLIRRQPQGQQQFSSLMFLQPSPPTLTRRSRVDQWLLLLLRALAIALIAFAFARPYVREESMLNINLDGRNLVLVLDTSASMQRDDVWKNAQAELKKVLDGLSPEDRVSLYTIDRSLSPVVPLESDRISDPAATQSSVRQAITEVEPTWFASELAKGLTATADMLSAAEISGGVFAGRSSEIVLVTDLQAQSGLEALQGYPWPETVQLDVRQILPAEPGNARANLMRDEASDEDDAPYRVRIENNPDSVVQTFELAWGDSRGPIDGTLSRVQVPAGQVRVLPMTSRPAGADRIKLLGDAWQDDNDVFVADVEKVRQSIALLSRKADKPENDAGFFLEKAPLSTPLVDREVTRVDMSELPAVLEDEATRSVVLEPIAGVETHVEALRDFAKGGGTVLLLLSQSGDAGETGIVQELFDAPDVVIGEAETDDYALIGWLDYRSPVFSPFADPRFNDFSKIRFWSHRKVALPADTNIRTVAKFDDLTPLLLRQSVGEGNIWMLTAGWQPSGSGLALSSKFLPILVGMLDPAGKLKQTQATFEVGEAIALDSPDIRILDVSGGEADDEAAKIGTQDVQFFKPGIFTVQQGDVTQQIAVQVPASEGQLTPQDKDVFEQYGVVLGKLKTDTERKDSARQMQIEELEKKQRMWQWLIAAGLVVLAVETLLAGWTARANASRAATT